MSVGQMLTDPVDVASSDTNSCSSACPASSWASTSDHFLLVEREEEDPVTLETVTRAEGLGDSLSLEVGKEHQQEAQR